MKTWIQNLVARLFGITIEDPDRIQREKRYAFIEGQRSVITVNELLGLRAVDRKTADGRPFTVLVPQLGHAMIDDGTVYKITAGEGEKPAARVVKAPIWLKSEHHLWREGWNAANVAWRTALKAAGITVADEGSSK